MSKEESGSMLKEKVIKGYSGWLMLMLLVAVLVASVYTLVAAA
jgi:hypothetical protein